MISVIVNALPPESKKRRYDGEKKQGGNITRLNFHIDFYDVQRALDGRYELLMFCGCSLVGRRFFDDIAEAWGAGYTAKRKGYSVFSWGVDK